MTLIAISIVGFLVAGVTQFSLPDGRSGNAFLAAILGLDGALIGAYIGRQFSLAPGLASTLFLSFLVATVLLAAYRGAFLRSIQGASEAAGTCAS